MSKPSLAEVVTLYETNASNIADMMRQAAESIETEDAEEYDLTRAMIAVQITEGRQIKVYGWGRTDIMDSIGVLTAGATYLTNSLYNSQNIDE